MCIAIPTSLFSSKTRKPKSVCSINGVRQTRAAIGGAVVWFIGSPAKTMPHSSACALVTMPVPSSRIVITESEQRFLIESKAALFPALLERAQGLAHLDAGLDAKVHEIVTVDREDRRL